MTAAPARPALPALTSVRFLAALQVVLYHFVSPAGLPGPLAGVVGAGYTGVSFFFVLSGFVLAYNYLPAPGLEPLDRARFWVARLARVYPLYLLALAIAGLVGLHELHTLARPGRQYAVGPVQVGLAVAMLQAWVPGSQEVLDPPAWSLSAEAFFYLLFPWLGMALVRFRPAALWPAAGLLWLASLAPPGLFLLLGAPAAWDPVLKFTPLLRLPEFGVGVAAGLLFLRRGPLPGRWATSLTVLAAGLLLLVLGASSQLPYRLLHNGLLAPLYVLLIVGLGSSGAGARRVLGARWALLLGEASYALYLLHVPLWDVAAVGLRALARPLAPGLALTFPLYLPLLLAGAVVAHLLVEQPARRALRRRLSPRPAPPARSPAPEPAGPRPLR